MSKYQTVSDIIAERDKAQADLAAAREERDSQQRCAICAMEELITAQELLREARHHVNAHYLTGNPASMLRDRIDSFFANKATDRHVRIAAEQAADLTQLRQDARRYRWLREGHRGCYNTVMIYAGSALDDAIDSHFENETGT